MEREKQSVRMGSMTQNASVANRMSMAQTPNTQSSDQYPIRMCTDDGSLVNPWEETETLVFVCRHQKILFPGLRTVWN